MEQAAQLLQRLPKLPPNITSIETARVLCHKSRRGYFLQNIYPRKNVGHDRAEMIWMQMCVTRKLNSVVLRLALYIANVEAHSSVAGRRAADSLKIHEIANATLELLRVAFKIAGSDKTQHKISWAIVQAYLWNSWQRIVMLFFHKCFGEISEDGESTHQRSIAIEQLSKLQGIQLIPELSRLRHEDLSQRLRAIPYLCSWSYRLLFETYFSRTTDLRSFFQAYSKCTRQEECKVQWSGAM